MQYNAVGWFEIYVQDMHRARKFYEAVFQITLSELTTVDIEMLVFPMSDQAKGCSGALVQIPGVPSGGSGTVVYFTCVDCAVEGSRVEAGGGRVHREKMSIGEHGFVCMAYDSEGNMIGLHSRQ